ncbi:MAG TPA: fibronectin type III domain-containing protein [Candidatus Kapabacteria bacterium]|nr:fibronectin type III domain-containing protein [Candidatus Kapabacteria bacterium]
MRISYSSYVVLAAVLFAGCLADNITGPQVVPQLVQPPTVVYYQADSAGKSTLKIRWSVSPTYINQNFKGYWVQLFTSDSVSNDPTVEDSVVTEIDSVFVPKSDTSYTFTNVNPLMRYTAQVWGVRYGPQSKPDSLVLSQYFSFVSFFFDPRPVHAPSSIFASSGPNSVSINLFWSRSIDENNKGFAGYIVRYEDTTRTNPHVYYTSNFAVGGAGDTTKGLRFLTVTVPPNQSPPLERPYKLWVKAIRKDSVESADSIGISWSGAERIASFIDTLDKGAFVGIIGQNGVAQYGLLQISASDPQSLFNVHYDGTNVTVNGTNGAKFVNRTDIARTLDDSSYFSQPFAVSDFSVTSVALPPTPQTGEGAVIYALLPDGSRVRMFFLSTNNSYITTLSSVSTVNISASFQPAVSNLPYF